MDLADIASSFGTLGACVGVPLILWLLFDLIVERGGER